MFISHSHQLYFNMPSGPHLPRQPKMHRSYKSTDCEVSDILEFRDGKTCHEGRDKLQSLWDLDMANIDLDLLDIKEPEDTTDMNINEENIDENDSFSVDVQYDDLDQLM